MYILIIWYVGRDKTVRSYWTNLFGNTDDSSYWGRLDDLKHELDILLESKRLIRSFVVDWVMLHNPRGWPHIHMGVEIILFALEPRIPNEGTVIGGVIHEGQVTFSLLIFKNSVCSYLFIFIFLKKVNILWILKFRK